MEQNNVKLIEDFATQYQRLHQEVTKVIIGQDQVVHDLLLAIFSQGHALLVGVPGLAKTLLVNTIAQSLGLSFKRIQFTPDLMPSDMTGSEILSEQREFRFIKGPIFANIVLADEINRTPPKTQAALLEAMQEKSVTVGLKTYPLVPPFFVLATQNPIEQEGTYPLPEAQLDRFMFNIMLDYPSTDAEIAIVKATTGSTNTEVKAVMDEKAIIHFQHLVRELPVTDKVYEYAVALVTKTRPNTSHASKITQEYISWGAGPRASQYLIIGAKTHAASKGKFAPDIEDVQAVAKQILRHRIVPNYHAVSEGITTDKIIAELMAIS